jgi:hypothetical protein
MTWKKALVVVTLLLAICPIKLRAMEIDLFYDMAAEDQLDYVKFLAKATEELLVQDGHRDLATRVDNMFRRKGDQMSAAERDFRNRLDRMRTFKAKTEGSPEFRLSAESAFLTTLVANRIRLSGNFHARLTNRVRVKPYWPKRPLNLGAKPVEVRGR